MERTQGPWKIGGNDNAIIGKEGVLVAGLPKPYTKNDIVVREANAAFIVKACNSFDALCQACILAGIFIDKGGRVEDRNVVIKSINAAIQQAQGE